MPNNRSVFRNAALLSGLVTPDQLEQAVLTVGVTSDAAAASAEAAGAATAAPIDLDDTLLANRLVEMGILTRYQADQIKTGRTKFNLGPYLVTEFIGKGGMGEVYKGVHQLMGRECAIKTLPLHK